LSKEAEGIKNEIGMVNDLIIPGKRGNVIKANSGKWSYFSFERVKMTLFL